MKIIWSLVLVAGLLMTQGCCMLGVICGLNKEAAVETPKPKKAAAPAKAKLSQPASELSKVADTTETANGILVKLKGDVLFARGQNGLSEEASKKIRDIAAVLKKYPQAKITVIGHTDNVGAESANQLLSEKRAASVKEELVKGGVSQSQVSSVGRGDKEPVAPNDSSANRAKNRRAVLKIENIK